jgi:TonB family protein
MQINKARGVMQKLKLNSKGVWKMRFSWWLHFGLALTLALVLPGGAAILGGNRAWAEESGRKIKTTVPPEYPDIAKKLNIRGTVRVEVTVAPDGTVKKVKELGGNPVLLDAFTHAVKQWKYETAPKESVFEIKYEFVP